MHRAQQRGQCTKSYILIQATWVFVDKMLNCSMMTSKINTEYTEFCRIMKRSRWSGFNNTHQSHYTMTESNRSLPPAYFNLLYTQRVSCHVSTQSTRWRQPPSIMSRTLIMLSTLKRSYSQQITICVTRQFCCPVFSCGIYQLCSSVYFLKKKGNLLKVVYLVLMVFWSRR